MSGDEPDQPDQPDRPRRRSEGGDRSGPVLPDRTRDEESLGWGEQEYDDDERLRREVPPHHH